MANVKALPFNTRHLFRALLAIFALALGGSASGAGVTVITHGFNGNVTDWIIPMAQEIPGFASFPGVTFSCYEISIEENGSGQTVATATFLGGVAPMLSDSGEILIKLDWSSLAGFGGASTTTVANAAVGALLSSGLIAEMGGRPLAELPLHLIGHSRGGSVVTEMGRLLGAQGVWVDQVTTLDPRPVPQFGDASVTTYVNVLFADNYWQTLGDGLFVPNGQSVFGAYNRKLTSLSGGYSSSHSDVHLWYHGTVDLGTPATDTQATIGSTQRSAWWTSTEAAGAANGFYHSAIGGGDRLSNVEPAGVGNGRVSDGFNRRWDLGGSVAANRTALPANSGLWPNLIRLLRADAQPVVAGGSVDLVVHQQSGANGLGTVEVRTFLDADFNPYNGNETLLDARILATTGTSTVMSGIASIALNADVAPPGSYALGARIGDGTRTRHLYLRERLTVAAPPAPPMVDAASLAWLSGGQLRFNVIGSPGQTATVLATADFVTWDPIGTHTFAGAVWDFTDTAAGSFPKRFYKAILVP